MRSRLNKIKRKLLSWKRRLIELRPITKKEFSDLLLIEITHYTEFMKEIRSIKCDNLKINKKIKKIEKDIKSIEILEEDINSLSSHFNDLVQNEDEKIKKVFDEIKSLTKKVDNCSIEGLDLRAEYWTSESNKRLIKCFEDIKDFVGDAKANIEFMKNDAMDKMERVIKVYTKVMEMNDANRAT